MFLFFKQKTAYEMRISDWSSDVCSADLGPDGRHRNGSSLRSPRASAKWYATNRACGRRRLAPATGGTRRSPARLLERRSEEHTSELQSLMRISYAVFCLKKKKNQSEKYQTSCT